MSCRCSLSGHVLLKVEVDLREIVQIIDTHATYVGASYTPSIRHRSANNQYMTRSHRMKRVVFSSLRVKIEFFRVLFWLLCKFFERCWLI